MKKILGLVVAFMTLINVSALAQCGTSNGFVIPQASEKPIIYGDFTPCKNQKNVTYTLGNRNPALSIQWTWCRGVAGQNVSSGFVPSEFRWSIDPNTGAKITDGVTTSGNSGLLYTTANTVAVSYKTKNTYLACFFKDSCGTWQELYGLTVNLNCDAGTGEYVYTAPAAVDTGRTVINADVVHAQYDMSFDLDSISNETGPYTNINMFVKCPTCSCTSNGAVWFSDGWYQKMRFSPDPTLPFNVSYGWSLYFASPTTPARTFRISGSSASGAWSSLPFTISTTVPSVINYPTLP